MVLHTNKNIIPIKDKNVIKWSYIQLKIIPTKDIVKTLPSNDISNYIKMYKDNVLEKQ